MASLGEMYELCTEMLGLGASVNNTVRRQLDFFFFLQSVAESCLAVVRRQMSYSISVTFKCIKLMKKEKVTW